MAKPKACKRCKATFQFNYTVHEDISACLRQAKIEEQQKESVHRAQLVQEYQRTAEERHKALEEERKTVKELNEKLAVKAAEDRPMSEAEMLSLTMLTFIERMCDPYGRYWGETSKTESKVRAELKRRGLL